MEHYLYSIEIIVKSMTLTKKNECAPDSYPVHAEFRFRDGLYMSISQNNFGAFTDKTASPQVSDNNIARKTRSTNYRRSSGPPFTARLGMIRQSAGQTNIYSQQNGNSKTGRCCVFVLDKPINDSDYLDLRVYKKAHDKCKFLIGSADIPIKEHFDNLMNKFYIANRSLELAAHRISRHLRGFSKTLTSPNPPAKEEDKPYDPTGAETEGRRAKSKPDEADTAFKTTTEESNECGIHSGTPFILDKPVNIVFQAEIQLRDRKGVGAGFVVALIRMGCMGRNVTTEIPFPEKVRLSKTCSGKHRSSYSASHASCSEELEILSPSDRNAYQQPRLHKIPESLNVSSSAESTAECESEESLPVIKPKVDRAAYEEFEADLNGCGLAIRVLKNSHKVSGVKRYEEPVSCNNSMPANPPNQKSAVVKLLSLICNVLQSVTAEQQPEREYLRSNCLHETNNANNKAPNMQQLCQCIQGMLGGNNKPLIKPVNCKSISQCCGKRRGQENDCKNGRNGNRRNNNGSKRQRGGCECDSQRNIMLFLESIRQVVSHKKGLSDLADLLLQCTCGSGSDGGGDRKCGATAIFRMILEKIKECADDHRPVEQKQSDLCGLVRTLTEIQNNDRCCRQRGGQQTSGCDELSRRSSVQASDNISCMVKKILELGVRYCSNRNIDLRNILCKVLADDTCNEELTNICRTIGQYLESDRNVVCDHMTKEASTGGVVNAPCLPVVRGNFKYPSGYDYGSASFTLPTAEDECNDDGSIEPYRKKNKLKECCVQIDGPDIDNTMKGINQKLPNGIEICRKGTMDLESDVFILKMGKKVATSDKKGLIEIELRTPKGPTTRRPQVTSVTTQVDEDMLKERVTASGTAGQGDKKGGKKGKGKGKGKGKKGKK